MCHTIHLIAIRELLLKGRIFFWNQEIIELYILVSTYMNIPCQNKNKNHTRKSLIWQSKYYKYTLNNEVTYQYFYLNFLNNSSAFVGPLLMKLKNCKVKHPVDTGNWALLTCMAKNSIYIVYIYMHVECY